MSKQTSHPVVRDARSRRSFDRAKATVGRADMELGSDMGKMRFGKGHLDLSRFVGINHGFSKGGFN